MLYVYTDGASSHKPRKCGGWAFCLVDRDAGLVRRRGGGEIDTNNQRMELRAVIEGLRAAAQEPHYNVCVLSDSEYVVKAFTENRLYAWRDLTNWTNTYGAPIKNREMWEELDALLNQMASDEVKVTFQWVRGHNGNKWNESCDKLAVAEKHRILGRIYKMEEFRHLTNHTKNDNKNHRGTRKVPAGF